MMPVPLRVTTLLLVGFLCACGPGPQTGADSGPGLVKGLVASAKTAEGIPNLLVALIHDGRIVRVMPTDDLGEFRFDGVPLGPYVVALTGVELSGLNPLHTVLTPSEQTVEVGDEPVDLTFAVVGVLPARIVGEVRCGDRPMVGVRIHVVGGRTDAIVETDQVGRYGATDLRPGKYTVTAMDSPCDLAPGIEIVSLATSQSIAVNFGGR